jgi:ABC-type transport system involved in multi-copper enzyme maturation permease subunit
MRTTARTPGLLRAMGYGRSGQSGAPAQPHGFVALRQAGIIARYELGRVLGGLRAKLVLALVPLVTVLPVALGAIHAGNRRRDLAIEQARGVALSVARWYNIDVARHLFECPTVVIRLVVFTAYLTPVLTFVLAYDQLAGEARKQTLRLFAARAPRESIVVGKVAAVSFLFCSVIAVSHAIVWAVDIARGRDAALMVLDWGACALGVSCLVAVSNIALWIFISALFARPKVALVVGLLVMLVLGAAHAVAHNKAPGWDGLTPGSVDQLLLSGRSALRWKGIGVVVAWCAGAMVGAIHRLRACDL